MGAVVSPNASANGNNPGRVVMRRADGKPINVLVVDDEPVLAELVSMALRYEGWEIATAVTARPPSRWRGTIRPMSLCST